MTEPYDWADDPDLPAEEIERRFRALPAVDEVFVWRPTPEEWEAYKLAALQKLGITYEELARQARESDFQSSEARHLWVVIGR